MAEIVERVKAAIIQAGAGCISAAVGGDCPFRECKCLAAAHDAIAAMREPTEAMMIPGMGE